MDALYGAAAGVVIVCALAGLRHWFWCKREDRRFEIDLKLRDYGRALRLREAGADEESITELQAEIEAARADADKGILL